MPTYFVASGGSNTSPYDTWAKAATSLQTALTAASTAGDIVVIQYDAVPSTDTTLSADTNYTFAGNIALVSASNDGGSAYTLTPMGASYFIGSDANSIHLAFIGNDRSVRVYGITLRIGGSSSKQIRLANAVGLSMEFESCYFWLGSANGACSTVLINNAEAYATYQNCVFRFGNIDHNINTAAYVQLIGCSISPDGSTPGNAGLFIGPGHLEAVGCDFSRATSVLVPNRGAYSRNQFDRCMFSATPTIFAAQTSNPTLASAEAFFSDCIFGTTRRTAFYNALGSVVNNTGLYYTGSEAGNLSWQITTTANCSYRTPFRTQWINWNQSGTSAITPRFEILRDGSTTAYTDAQVWAEFSYKNTASSPLAGGIVDDAQALAAFLAGTAASDQAAGAGLAAWTGEAASAWSGKCAPGSSFTPTEAGILRGRICVGAPSITVYVDPVIRTA